MRIVAAGGTGQIGQKLCALLAADGHDVWVLTRQARRPAPRTGVYFAEWDGKAVGAWGDLVDGADAVLNLAGENIGAKLWTGDRLELIRGSRVAAGRALTEAVRKAAKKPTLFLQASAVGYYGTQRVEALDETAPAGADELASICLSWEESTRGVEALGVRRVIVRTGLVLEKDQGVLPSIVLPFRFFAGGPLGNGRQVLSWIHIEDELAALRFLIETPDVSGAYNLTAPAPATNREFGKTLAAVIHRPFWLPAPGFALKLVLGRMSKLVLEGQRVLPARLTQAGFTFRYPELRGALEDLLV